MAGSQLDLSLGVEHRDRALDAVASSHAAWCVSAIAVIRTISTGCEFTTDELWSKLPKPTEPRAMGAAIRDARKLGLIHSTGRYIKSHRPECNARPVAVWRRS